MLADFTNANLEVACPLLELVVVVIVILLAMTASNGFRKRRGKPSEKKSD